MRRERELGIDESRADAGIDASNGPTDATKPPSGSGDGALPA
jgi:hypothetical protein